MAEINGMVGTVIVDQDVDVDEAWQFIDGDWRCLSPRCRWACDALASIYFCEEKKRTKGSLPRIAAEQAYDRCDNCLTVDVADGCMGPATGPTKLNRPRESAPMFPRIPRAWWCR